MLENADREKIEKYVDKVLGNIYSDVKRNVEDGMRGREVIDATVRLTVNKITPESKMILSSTYNMLMERTLAGDLYNNPQNKAAFYSADILKKLNSHFVFDVPDHIDYEESRSLLNKWTEAGIIVAVGGGFSISMKKVFPVIVAVALAGIMLFLLRNQPVSSRKPDVEALVKEYLKNVKLSLLNWVDEVVTFYEDEIVKLEKEIE